MPLTRDHKATIMDKSAVSLIVRGVYFEDVFETGNLNINPSG